MLHLLSTEGRSLGVLLCWLATFIARCLVLTSLPLNWVQEVLCVAGLSTFLARGTTYEPRVPLSDRSCYALVTGASSGVGREVAKRLAKLGMNVIITGRNSSRLHTTKSKIVQEYHVDVIAEVLDVSDRCAVQDMCHRLCQRNINLVLLVNNAGELVATPQSDASGTFERMMATNVFAPMMLAELLMPQLRKGSIHTRKPSRIVNVASCAHTLVWRTPNALAQCQELASRRTRVSWYNFVYYYGLSKLCLIWSTSELSRRLDVEQQRSCHGTPYREGRVVAVCCHPGIIGSLLYRALLPSWIISLLYIPSLLVGKTCYEGSTAVIRACVDESVVLGPHISYMLCDGDHGESSPQPLLSSAATNASVAAEFQQWATSQLKLS